MKIEKQPARKPVVVGKARVLTKGSDGMTNEPVIGQKYDLGG